MCHPWSVSNFNIMLRQLIWHVCITCVMCVGDLHVIYSSPYDGGLVVDRPVIFDASRSTLSEGPYSVQYIWGDGETTVVDDISKPVQHVYKDSGLFTVRLIANNRLPSELGSEGTWRIDKSGNVVPVLDVPVYINSANRLCYKFVAWTVFRGVSRSPTLVVEEGATATIYAQVDNALGAGGETRGSLTTQYMLLGETPSYTIHDHSRGASKNLRGVFTDIVSDPLYGNCWKAEVQFKSSTAPMSLRVESGGSVRAECSIEDTYFDLVVGSITTSMGDYYNTTKTTDLNLVGTSQVAISTFDHNGDSSVQVLHIGSVLSPERKSLKGLVATTDGLFGPMSTQIFDLLGPGSKLCHMPTNCLSSVIVKGVHILRSLMLVNTNRGVYAARRESVGDLQLLKIGYCQREGGSGTMTPCSGDEDCCPSKDSCNASCKRNGINIDGSTKPYKVYYKSLATFPTSRNDDPLYLVEDSNGVLDISYSQDILHREWHHFDSILLGLKGGEDIASLVRNVYTQCDVALICRKSDRSNCRIVIHDDGAVTAGHVFAPELVIHKIIFLSLGTTLLGYGKGIWTSYDGGYTFESNTALINGEYVATAALTDQSNAFALLTSQGRVLYGKEMRSTIVVLGEPIAPAPAVADSSVLNKLWSIAFDNSGRLWLLEVSRNLFLSPSGEMVTRILIPIENHLNSYIIKPPSDAPQLVLVPSWVSGSIIIYVRNLRGSDKLNEIFKSTMWPLESHDGFQLNVPNTGSLIIDNALYDSAPVASFEGSVTDSLVSCDRSECPAIGWDLSLVATGAGDGTYYAKLLGSDDIKAEQGWLGSDIGRSVMLNFGSFLLTNVVNSTCAKVTAVHKCSGLNAIAGSWNLIDLRCGWQTKQGLRVDATQLETVVTKVTSKQYQVVIAAGSAKWTAADHIGKVFITSKGWGVITKVVDSTTVTVVPSSAGSLSAGVLPSGSWFVSDGAADPRSPSNLHMISTPHIVLPECPYYDFSDNSRLFFEKDLTAPLPLGFTDENVLDLDFADVFNITSTIQLSPQVLRKSNMKFSDLFSIRMVNSRRFIVTSSELTFSGTEEKGTLLYAYSNSAKLFAQYNMAIEIPRLLASNITSLHNSIRSLVVLLPTEGSLKCKRSNQMVDISVSCPAGTTLEVHYVDPEKVKRILTPEMFLTDGDKDGNPWISSSQGTLLFYDIPVNYRPPSDLGGAWPKTEHVYNADGTKDFDQNFFPGSTQLAKFKKCSGKTHEDCECTPEEKVSDNIQDSDCNERALRVYFGNTYVPHIVNKIDGVVVNQHWNYTMEELNGRADWCYASQELCDSRVQANTLSQIQFNPSKDDGIRFTGGGLFHYRVKVVSGTTLCNHEAYFKIWVNQAPYPGTTMYAAMSTTAITCGVLLLATYVVYNFKYMSGSWNGYTLISPRNSLTKRGGGRSPRSNTRRLG